MNAECFQIIERNSVPIEIEDPPEYYCRIDLMGCLGVGKSHLCELIREHLGIQVLEEAFRDNPFLRDFYRDPSRWAFQSQLYFILNKTSQIKEITDQILPLRPVVVDQSPLMDYVFALNAYRSELMTKKEWELYERIYRRLMADIPPPSLVVVLLAEPEISKQRADNRGRKMEMDIPLTYYQALTNTVGHWVDTNRDNYDIVVVKTDDLDLTNSERDIKLTMDFITGQIERVEQANHLLPSSASLELDMMVG